MIPHAYRVLLRDRRARRLLSGLGVSSLGDGMSTSRSRGLPCRTAPAGELGLFVGLASPRTRFLGQSVHSRSAGTSAERPARALVLAHCLLRTAFLGAIVARSQRAALHTERVCRLLAGSSLLASWGNAGQYTMLAELGGDDGRLAANSLASAQVWLATILGPRIAGLLLTRIAPGWLLAFDAASFAFLGAQAWRMQTATPTTDSRSIRTSAESGFRLLRRNDLLGLIALTWLFFFLYGPVEDALPVYVAHDLHAHARLLGAYWTSFGVGALASTLLTGALRGHATRRITLLIVAGGAPASFRSPSRPLPSRSCASPSAASSTAPSSPHVCPVPVDHLDRESAERARGAQRCAHRRRSARHRGRRADRRRPRRRLDAHRFRGRDRSPCGRRSPDLAARRRSIVGLT